MSQPQLSTEPGTSKSRLKEINVFVLIFAVLVISVILTYLLPAGSYERVEVNGRSVVDPSTFKFAAESTPVNFLGLFKSIHTGMEQTAGIIFFVLIIGGTFGVLTTTGAIEALIVTLSKKLANKEKWLIPIMMLFFGMGGSLMGMAEETIPYIGILIPLAIALGFDAITGTAIVLIGASVGFTSAIMNPFTVGLAQGLAELPTFSGMPFRIGVFIVMYLVSVAYVFRYAMKVKQNPSLGFLGAYAGKSKEEMLNTDVTLTTRHKWILASFLINFCVLAFGVVKYGWYITEIAGLFVLLAIVFALIGKLSANQMVESFMKGASALISGALIIGVARAVVVVMNDGHILDTILYYFSSAIGHLPATFSAVGMLVLQTLLSFIVPSGSGEAALTMPIMTPLADLLGVTRQTAVLAYQFGDGISNIFIPTSGYFMAGLAIAGIPWIRWMKWILPLILIQYGIAVGAVVLAQIIGYGPF